MLLAASSSNHHFIIGVRPRAVTAPMRLRSLSGTWGKMSARREDLSLKPASTRTAHGAPKKTHWLSTVRVPGPRANLKPAKVRLPSPSTYDPARRTLAPIVVPPVSTETTAIVQSPVPQAAAAPPARPESPLAHARRGAGTNVPPPCVVSSDTTHTLSIALPRPGGAPLDPEMITVSARRGGRLVVVADAWHLEHDCERPFFFFGNAGSSHSLSVRRRGVFVSLFFFFAGHYEWQVALPPREVDLGAVRARFGEDGTLVIDVPRRPPRSGTRLV